MTYTEEQYNDVLRTTAAQIQSLTSERDELKALLLEHQQLSDKAIEDAKVQIKILANNGADVSGLVAILTDAAIPMNERKKAAIQAEIDATAVALAKKQAELASLNT